MHAVILANTSRVLADIMLVLGLTGIRWGGLQPSASAMFRNSRTRLSASSDRSLTVSRCGT